MIIDTVIKPYNIKLGNTTIQKRVRKYGYANFTWHQMRKICDWSGWLRSQETATVSLPQRNESSSYTSTIRVFNTSFNIMTPNEAYVS